MVYSVLIQIKKIKLNYFDFEPWFSLVFQFKNQNFFGLAEKQIESCPPLLIRLKFYLVEILIHSPLFSFDLILFACCFFHRRRLLGHFVVDYIIYKKKILFMFLATIGFNCLFCSLICFLKTWISYTCSGAR